MHSIAALKIYGKLLLGRKFLGTTAIFRSTDSRFCMEVPMDSPNKLKKYKSTKSM